MAAPRINLPPLTSRTGFAGVYPILYAFFDSSGRLDAGAMRRQVEACLAAGAHGIAILGLVTEVNRLETSERRALVEMVARDIDGRVPLAVTVAEQSIAGQREFVRMAEDNGADWVILQPPLTPGYPEAEYVKFIGAVAEKARVPVGVQNNPTNLAVALTNASLQTLGRNHANIKLLKGEGPAINVARLIADSGGAFDVFCGHGGRELMTNLRSGCVGLIPAPDVFDVQVKILRHYAAGTPVDLAEAERLHRSVLPFVTFVLQSLPIMLCYGKRLFAQRVGITGIHDRAPAIAPSEFGLAEMARLTSELGPWPG